MKGDFVLKVVTDKHSTAKPEAEVNPIITAIDYSRSSSFSSVKEDDQGMQALYIRNAGPNLSGVSQSFLVSSRSKDHLAEDQSEEWTKCLAALCSSLVSKASDQLWSIEEDALSLHELSRSSSLVDLGRQIVEEPTTLQSAKSPLERLPTEILGAINLAPRASNINVWFQNIFSRILSLIFRPRN